MRIRAALLFLVVLFFQYLNFTPSVWSQGRSEEKKVLKPICGHLLNGPAWNKFSDTIKLLAAVFDSPDEMALGSSSPFDQTIIEIVFVFKDFKQLNPLLGSVELGQPVLESEGQGYVTARGKLSDLLSMAENPNILRASGSFTKGWVGRPLASEIHLDTEVSSAERHSLLSGQRTTVQLKTRNRVRSALHASYYYRDGYKKGQYVVAVLGEPSIRISLVVLSAKVLSNRFSEVQFIIL